MLCEDGFTEKQMDGRMEKNVSLKHQAFSNIMTYVACSSLCVHQCDMSEKLFAVCGILHHRLILLVLRFDSTDRNIRLTKCNIVAADMQITLSSVEMIKVMKAPNTLNTAVCVCVYSCHFLL